MMRLIPSGFKRLLLLFVFVLFSTIATSQVLIVLLFGDKLSTDWMKAGVSVGMNLTNIDGLENDGLNPGFQFGTNFQIRIKNQFYIKPELIFTNKMGNQKMNTYLTGDPVTDSLFKSGQVDRTFNYMSLPINVGWTIKNRFITEVGIIPSYLTKSTDLFYRDDYEYTKHDVASAKFDFAACAGLGYNFTKGNGFKLIVRGWRSFTQVNTNNYNQGLSFVFQIPIVGGSKTGVETTVPKPSPKASKE